MTGSEGALPRLAIRQLAGGDVALMRALLATFGEAFDETSAYTAAQPDDAYLARLLASEPFIALAATLGDEVVGGIAAYELRKFERARSEVFVYDLAVAPAHRRRGIATALIGEIRRIAASRDAYVVFVQAERADAPAVALYSRFAARQEVLHFDIAVPPGKGPT